MNKKRNGDNMSDEFDDSPYVSPSMTNDIRNAMAKNMAENGTEQKSDAVFSLPTPNIENLFDKYRPLFREETVSALENKVNSMISVNDDGSISQVRYLGKRADVSKLDDLITEVVKNLEVLSGAGYIQGSLLPLSSLQLNDDQVAVLSYVMLTADGVQFFDKHCNDISIHEGGLPNKL
jgi:hypothetical protein